jgi:hypothetical protein
MMDKPVVLVTRRVPPPVEARLRRDYRACVNEDDRIWGRTNSSSVPGVPPAC